MRYADANVIKIKHAVLEEVARLAFAGELEERKDEISFKLIPGPTAQFRCCIYKEREIIRQRVRLAEGKAPGVEDNGNVIQVISSACEDCPISSYTVTENCQNCIGKACINACKFGAIEPGRSRTHIDPSKCKECGKCAEACPYNAIAHLKRPCKFRCPVDAISYDEYGISVIDDEKCIRCGKCIHSCPFGAIGSKTWIVDVIKAIQSEKPVYAMLAPATEGQFGPDITMASWRKAMKELGFTEFVEVGLGGDLTAKYEAEEWREAYQEGKKKVTSCCPGFVNMVRKHYPELNPSAPMIEWDLTGKTDEFLPKMYTDITLENSSKILIIDTKCYSRILLEQYDKKSINSANLYQIYAYVKNKSAKTDKNQFTRKCVPPRQKLFTAIIAQQTGAHKQISCDSMRCKSTQNKGTMQNCTVPLFRNYAK